MCKFDCYKFSFPNLLVIFSQKAIGLSLHETVRTKSTFSALRLSYSKEQSNTYGVKASNYGELLCYPAQGICLFFPTDLRHALVWEKKKAGAQCLCRRPGKVHSPLGCTSSCNSFKFSLVNQLCSKKAFKFWFVNMYGFLPTRFLLVNKEVITLMIILVISQVVNREGSNY